MQSQCALLKICDQSIKGYRLLDLGDEISCISSCRILLDDIFVEMCCTKDREEDKGDRYTRCYVVAVIMKYWNSIKYRNVCNLA